MRSAPRESWDEAMAFIERAYGDVLSAGEPGQPAESGHGASDGGLIPGMTIADGRIRLLISYGGPRHLQLWQAADTATGRHLAVTIIDSAGCWPAATVDGILSDTAKLRGIDLPGLARVLDVGRDECGGVVVCGWVRGATLKEVANTEPSPIGAADAVLAVAETAEAVHRAGLALSIDHPDRVRVSVDGHVVLAFPATMSNVTPRDDLRGIGAVMYGLLVNRWPLEAESGTEWEQVETDAAGRVQEPAELNDRIPFLISAMAAGLVRQRSGIRSAGTVSALLREASDEAKKGAADITTREPPPLPPPGGYAGFGNFGPKEQTESARRQLLKASLGAAAAVILVLLVAFASSISRILNNGNTNVAYDADKLGLQTPPPTPPPTPSPSARSAQEAVLLPILGLKPPAGRTAAAPPAAPVSPPPAPSLPAPLLAPTAPAPLGRGAAPVKPVRASVFSPGGSPDNPNRAGLSIDGDPATAWSTDTYFDAVPFPRFKEGVGLLLELPQPTSLGTVTVDLNSSGTVVQLRSSPTPTLSKLSDSTVISPPTPLQPGHNRIQVTNPAPTTNVLVWITTLGNTGGKSQSDISEVTLQAANTRG